MEGRGPYRIYDPGGSTPLGEASAAFERLVLENTRLKGQIQGIKTLGKADRALPLLSLFPQPAMPAPSQRLAGASTHHVAVPVTQC